MSERSERELTERRIRELTAFDQLPPAIRRAVSAAPYGVSAPHLLGMLRAGKCEKDLLAFVAWSETASRELAILHCGVIPETTLPQLRDCTHAKTRPVPQVRDHHRHA